MRSSATHLESSEPQAGDTGWVVTSKHKQTRAPALETWEPFGLLHAKQVNSSRTACGANADAWPSFRGLALESDRGPVCSECLSVVTRSASERWRASSESNGALGNSDGAASYR